MPQLRFVWDDRKSRSNTSKHAVSFEEAVTVFYDEHALFLADPEHSDVEDRFLLLGLSSGLRILVVCHCWLERGDVVRIISARKANRSERADYNLRLRS